jgi:hypothetical protein
MHSLSYWSDLKRSVLFFEDGWFLVADRQYLDFPKFSHVAKVLPSEHVETLRLAVHFYLLDVSKTGRLDSFERWFNRTSLAKLAAKEIIGQFLAKIDIEFPDDESRLDVLRVAKAAITEKINYVKDRDKRILALMRLSGRTMYNDRKDKSEKPWHYLFRLYGVYDKEDVEPLAYLSQAMLRKLDPHLYRGFHQWCLNNTIDPDSVLRRTRTSIQKRLKVKRKRLITFDQYIKNSRLKHPRRMFDDRPVPRRPNPLRSNEKAFPEPWRRGPRF